MMTSEHEWRTIDLSGGHLWNGGAAVPGKSSRFFFGQFADSPPAPTLA
jgi:hypothetical protein